MKEKVPITESVEKAKISVEILPGEYSYSEAVNLVKEKSLYILSSFGEGRDEFIRSLIKDGSIVEGEYWDANGETPNNDDLGFFKVLPKTETTYGYSHGFKYPDDKCKVIVWNVSPGESIS
jgi:hypothetical protein